MLDRVGQGLGDDEVDGGLERLGQPLLGDALDDQRQRRARGERLQRGREAAVGEHGGVQPAGELAQLGQRLLELVRGAAQQRHRGVGVAELLLEHPQLDGERDQPLLRAVVQVALQPPALGHARLEDAHPRRVDLRPRLGALQRQRDQLGEARQAGLGVRAERADRRDQHEPPDPPARHDRRGDRGAEAVGAHQLRGAPAHVRVVLDPRGLAGARDDRGQPVAVGERDRGADDEAARVVLVGPAPDRPRLPALVADRRRRAHVQQPPGLLGDGLEDLLGLGRGGHERRDPPQRRLLLGELRERLVRARVEHHPDQVVVEQEQRAGDRHPPLAADPHPAPRPLPASSARSSRPAGRRRASARSARR